MQNSKSSPLSKNDIDELWRFVYNIAVRMLFYPHDAEDAVQDILLKVIDSYPKFQNRSSLKTWVYKIAVNYLIDEKRKKKNQMEIDSISFDSFSDSHAIDYEVYNTTFADELELKLYTNELKISCTYAMLQCLDTKNRIIFILGSIFSLDSTLASEILEMKPEAYRKRLSRNREKMTNFMTDNCGLLNPEAHCSCRKRLGFAFEMGRLKKDSLLFAQNISDTIEEYCLEMEELDEVAEIYRSHPYYKLPENLKNTLVELVSNNALKVFSAKSM